MRRQPAQAIGLAAVSLVAMVGMLAFVIDAGMLFMAHREAQDAADAAALAGVRDLSDGGTTCSGACAEDVNRYATSNYAILDRLCSGSRVTRAEVGSLNPNPLNPIPAKVPILVVTVRCDASLTFGRILWSAGDSPTFKVEGTAVAAIGNAVIGANGLPTGDLTDFKLNPSCTRPPPPGTECAATGASGNVLSFGGGNFQPDTSALKGFTLQFTDGALTGQTFQIVNNDKATNTIQLTASINGPVAGSHFTILEHTTRLVQ